MPICELYNLQDWINVNDLYDEFHIISTAVLLHKTNDFYIHAGADGSWRQIGS